MIPKYRVGLIGHNISYSRSSDIYAAIFRQLGIDGDFCLFDVPNAGLDSVAHQLRRESFVGVAVTIPHKRAMLSYLDRKSDAVAAIGATNSIGIRQTSLLGHNTDCDGFEYVVRELAEMSKVKNALILGNGGSARAVVYSLATALGCRDFVVCGRSQQSLSVFRDQFLARIPQAKFSLCTPTEEMPERTSFDVVVNCTPLGGWHFPDISPFPDRFDLSGSGVFIDLNYNDHNMAVRKARLEGIPAYNGSAMLVAQALKSFELWTDHKVPFAAIFAAVFPEAGNATGNTT